MLDMFSSQIKSIITIKLLSGVIAINHCKWVLILLDTWVPSHGHGETGTRDCFTEGMCYRVTFMGLA